MVVEREGGGKDSVKGRMDPISFICSILTKEWV